VKTGAYAYTSCKISFIFTFTWALHQICIINMSKWKRKNKSTLEYLLLEFTLASMAKSEEKTRQSYLIPHVRESCSIVRQNMHP
jgi:hypothetical protein